MLWNAARVRARAEYLCVEHDGVPDHYWGNLLIFPKPPEAGDLEQWEQAFQQELPQCGHRTFAWDAPVAAGDRPMLGAVDEFLVAGYEIVESLALVAAPSDVKLRGRAGPDIEVRAIDAADDDAWQQVLDLQVITRDVVHAESAYREYVVAQNRHRRAMVAAGIGRWMTAWADGRVVADMGIIGFGGRGRYQSVETHPDYRRRGICSRLLHECARIAGAELGVQELVIVADPDDHAARVYERVGFVPVERVAGVCWWPREGDG